MVTREQSKLRRRGSWCIGVRIESLGTVDGPYTFHAGDAPTYATGDPLWMPLLMNLPDTLSSRVSARGGMRDAGAFNFALFDEDDFLTQLFRWHAPQRTQLWDKCDANDVVIKTRQSVFVDQLIHVERETMIVSAVNLAASPPEATVTRGALGTEPAAHEYRAAVRLYPPRLERRHVELFMVASDADDDDQRIVLDQFIIRKCKPATSWCGYDFECASFALGLKRTIGDIASGFYRVTHMIRGQTMSLARVGIDRSLWAGVDGAMGKTINPWPGENSYYLLDDRELIIGAGSELGGVDQIRIIQRGRLGTSLIDLITDGVYAGSSGPSVRPVLVASKIDGLSSFRRSPTGATSRADPNDWEQDTHFTTLMLCLFTSSRHPDDGLELVNFAGGYANYSSLAPGWGAGVHHSKINFRSFERVRLRTPDWLFDGLIISKPEKLWELIQKHFLEPLGAFITLDRDQKITLVLPRAPYEGLNLAGFDLSTILAERQGSGVYRPSISADVDPGATIRGVAFKLRGPNGEPVTNFIPAADLGTDSVGSRVTAGEGDDILEISLTSVVTDQAGFTPFLEELALRLLSRIQDPPTSITLQADLEVYDHEPGSLASVLWPLGPDHVTGGRGWEDVAIVAERSISLSAIQNRTPFGPDFALFRYGSSRKGGLIAPSAIITAWDPMTNTATIAVNRYTDVDAGADELPDDDLESFLAQASSSEMKLILLEQDGELASPTGPVGRFQEVIASALPDEMTFDGDWDGTAAVGLVITLADYDDARPADRITFVAYADEETRTISDGVEERPYAET